MRPFPILFGLSGSALAARALRCRHAVEDLFRTPELREHMRPIRESSVVRARAQELRRAEQAMIKHAGASDGEELALPFADLATLVFLLASITPAAFFVYRFYGRVGVFVTLFIWMFFCAINAMKLVFGTLDRKQRRINRTATDWSEEHRRLLALVEARHEALAIAEAIWRANSEAGSSAARTPIGASPPPRRSAKRI